MRWLKHAFAVEPEGPAEPTDEQRVIVDRLCKQIVRNGLTTAAILFLKSSQPLSYIGAQTMHFFEPVVTVIANPDGYRKLATFLERRGSVDYLCRRLEELEDEADRRRSDETSDNVSDTGEAAESETSTTTVTDRLPESDPDRADGSAEVP